MKLPIDTSAMQFIAVMPPIMSTEYGTDTPKLDKNGQVMWTLQVAAMAEGSADILKVKHPGEPKVEIGAPLRLHGLVASPYEMKDRSGVSFLVDRIEPVTGARKDG